MVARCSVFVATSLDGYIARPDGGIDWLDRANAGVPSGEDCGYHAFIETVDVLVMGRRTFEQVLTFGEWPYGARRLVVMSSKSVAIPPAIRGTVSASSETPAALVDRLSREGARHLYVDGGLTIQSFLREGLVDELIVTVIPILLGAGRPLFGSLDADIELEHLSTRAYEFGFVQSRYSVMAAGRTGDRPGGR